MADQGGERACKCAGEEVVVSLRHQVWICKHCQLLGIYVEAAISILITYYQQSHIFATMVTQFPLWYLLRELHRRSLYMYINSVFVSSIHKYCVYNPASETLSR